jgi:hypothetical protein
VVEFARLSAFLNNMFSWIAEKKQRYVLVKWYSPAADTDASCDEQNYDSISELL